MVVEVRALTGIYEAEGSIRGEIKYVLGKLMGTAHCALCDITHRGISQKKGFVQCREALPVEMSTVHLDERTDDIRDFSAGKTPCVIAHTTNGLLIVLDAQELEDCQGSVTVFRDALDRQMAALNLSFKTPTADLA